MPTVTVAGYPLGLRLVLCALSRDAAALVTVSMAALGKVVTIDYKEHE